MIQMSWSSKDNHHESCSSNDHHHESCSSNDYHHKSWSSNDHSVVSWSPTVNSWEPWSSNDHNQESWSSNDIDQKSWSSNYHSHAPWSSNDHFESKHHQMITFMSHRNYKCVWWQSGVLIIQRSRSWVLIIQWSLSGVFLVADMRLHLAVSVGRCVSVRPPVRHIFEIWAVFALLPLPNRPRLDCRVSGLVLHPF